MVHCVQEVLEMTVQLILIFSRKLPIVGAVKRLF